MNPLLEEEDLADDKVDRNDSLITPESRSNYKKLESNDN